MSQTFQNYQGYKETQAKLQEDMIQLENACRELKMEETADGIAETRKKIAKDKFNVAVVGEFKRAKSTLINGLLGKRILPADPLPCSATLNRVTYDVMPRASIQFIDGTSKDIPVEDLREYVTKLTDESEEVAATIKEATVYYPLVYCKNNVDIIDTPGLNDDDSMTNVALSVISEVDLSIVAIMALAPFSQYEKDFLENKLMSSDVGKIIFAVTKIDLVDEEDRDRIIKHIRKEIEKHILVKARKVYGEDSEEYHNYLKKLDNIQVIGISPKLALEGKERGDADMIERSNYPEFEKLLEKMLLEDRGMIALNTQINKIMTASTEIMKVLSIYESSASMSEEEFERKYQETEQAFQEIRAQRKEEEERIEFGCRSLVQKANELIESYWIDAEKGAADLIDQMEIQPEDVKKDRIEATQQEVSQKIGEYLNNEQMLFYDKLEVLVNDAVGVEIEKIGEYEEQFFQSVANAHVDFTAKADADSENSMIAGAGGTIVSALLTQNIIGAAAGGIYAGYKQAGAKGALVGGAASIGGALAANTIGNIVIATTGLTVLGWPLLIGVGIVGAVCGKGAVDILFDGGVRQVTSFRDNMKEAVRANLRKMKEDVNMEKQIRGQIEQTYMTLRTNLRDETEQILRNTENTLEQLKKERMESEMRKEQENDRRIRVAELVNVIIGDITELNQALGYEKEEQYESESDE